MTMPANPTVPKDGILTITDGTTPTPLSWEVMYEDGDFKVGKFRKDQMQLAKFKDRGKTYAVRETEDDDVQWSFTCHLVATTDSSSGTPLDVARRTGAWTAAKSTLPTSAGGGPTGTGAYTIMIAWTAERSNFGGSADAGIALKYSSIVIDDVAEGVPGKFSISGEDFNISTDAYAVT